MGESASDRGRDSIDVEAARSVLAEHPIRLAVLFGSTARDDRHPRSDVDVAVEFDPDASDSLDTRLSLWADLSVALDRNDIDLADVDELDPAVGVRVFTEGELLLGFEDRFADLRRRFRRRANRSDTNPPPAERFDAALERLERVMDG